MNVKCKCCGKKIDKNDGIRVPAIANNEHGSFYYCSAKCLGNGLTIKCEGAIVVGKIIVDKIKLHIACQQVINEHNK